MSDGAPAPGLSFPFKALLILLGTIVWAWLMWVSIVWQAEELGQRTWRPPVLHGNNQPREGPPTGSFAAVCAIFKNEHGNLREWVEYHR
jgi:hypothetical protein